MNLDDELFSAIDAQNYYNVWNLVANGADVNAKGSYGSTPLHQVAYGANTFKIVRYLVDKGADVNAKDDNGSTPLHRAVYVSDDLNIISYLVAEGANIDSSDGDGNTVLHYAAIYSSLNIVKYLVEKGANINARNHAGNTPLHLASGFVKNLEKVKYLVEKGADIKAQNNENQTPLEFAQAKCPKCQDIIDFLKSASSGIQHTTEFIKLTTSSNRTQEKTAPVSHVRKRRHVRHASDRNIVRFKNPEGHLPIPIAAHAVHVKEVPQLDHVQDGASFPQAVPYNTISSLHGTVSLVDFFVRMFTKQKPVFTTVVADLSQEQQVLSNALSTSNDFEGFMATLNKKLSIDDAPGYVAQPQENLYLGSTEMPKSCVDDASICNSTKSIGL